MIGGTKISCDIVETAKDMGIETHVADYNEDSPAKEISDYAYEVDVFDVDALERICRQNNIDGVMYGFSDILLKPAFDLSERMGYRYFLDNNQIEISTNKNKFREFCVEKGVRVARSFTLDDEVEFPVIIKPVDASGSKGVSICHNMLDFKKDYSNAIKYSRAGRVLIEQFIEGDEFTACYYISDDGPYLSAFADRNVVDDQGTVPLPVSYNFNSKLKDVYLKKANDSIIRFINELEVKNGMAFFQFRYSNNEFYLYDLGFRLTGTFEYKFLDFVFDFNPLKLMIDYSVGNDNQSGIPNFNMKKLCYSIYFNVKPGKIQYITDKEKLLNIPNVIYVFNSYENGDEIGAHQVGQLSQVAIRVLVCCDTLEEFKRTENEVIDIVEVLDSNGNTMLLPVYSKEDIYE